MTDGQHKIFISTDGMTVRLIIQDSVAYCSHVVSMTNYPGIFLTTANPLPSAFTALNPKELEIHTYVNNRDDYLYNHLIDQMELEFSKVLQHDCVTQQQTARTDSFMRHQNPGLIPYAVGNSTFATAAGEVLYMYQCRPVYVRALEPVEGICYSTLPVQEIGKIPAIPLFMEPLTHQLSPVGIRIPCSSQFLPKYRNIEGSWLTVGSQHLTRGGNPLELDKPEQYTVVLDRSPDWAHGGIYSRDQLEDMQNYIEFGRAKEALGAQLRMQTREEHGSLRSATILSVDNIFPEFTTIGTASYFSKRLWTFLHQWGEICSVLIMAATLIRIAIFMIETAYNIALFRSLFGCSIQILWSLCSNIFILKQFQPKSDAPVPEHQPMLPPDPAGSSGTPKSEQRTDNIYEQDRDDFFKGTRHYTPGTPGSLRSGHLPSVPVVSAAPGTYPTLPQPAFDPPLPLNEAETYQLVQRLREQVVPKPPAPPRSTPSSFRISTTHYPGAQ